MIIDFKNLCFISDFLNHYMVFMLKILNIQGIDLFSWLIIKVVKNFNNTQITETDNWKFCKLKQLKDLSKF